MHVQLMGNQTCCLLYKSSLPVPTDVHKLAALFSCIKENLALLWHFHCDWSMQLVMCCHTYSLLFICACNNCMIDADDRQKILTDMPYQAAVGENEPVM